MLKIYMYNRRVFWYIMLRQQMISSIYSKFLRKFRMSLVEQKEKQDAIVVILLSSFPLAGHPATRLFCGFSKRKCRETSCGAFRP